MKAKDELRTSTLRLLLAAVKTSEVQSEKHEATETELQEIVHREVKRRNEAIEEYRRYGREDLVEKEQAEFNILKAYLPEQLDAAAVTATIRDVIKNTGAAGAQDFGKVMKEVTSKTKGRADGKIVSEIVKRLLAASN